MEGVEAVCCEATGWKDFGLREVGMAAKIEMFLVLVVAVGAGVEFRHGPWTPMRIAGAVVFYGGLVLWLVARVQLGKSFSMRARATRLVTTGVYSRIRNPIYVAGQVMFLGAALFVPSWIPLVVVSVTVPMQVVRARKEALVLHEAFGEEYEAYRRRTWF